MSLSADSKKNHTSDSNVFDLVSNAQSSDGLGPAATDLHPRIVVISPHCIRFEGPCSPYNSSRRGALPLPEVSAHIANSNIKDTERQEWDMKV